MQKYEVQVELYTRYFFKVMLDNISVMIYTVGLPLFFLVLNLKDDLFKSQSLAQFTGHVMPFVAWIIMSNTIVQVGEVVLLREQGYLKQYASLVVNPSVFIVSKALVNLGILVVILGLVAGLSMALFQLAFWTVLWRLLAVLLLVSVPIWGYCLPILSFRMRYQTVNGVINVVTLAVMLGSAAVGNWLNVATTNVFANVLSPVYLVLNCFDVLVTGAWGTFLPGYLVALVSLSAIGWFSYRRLQLLPAEGL